jgi:hypothetical protein
MCCGYGFGSRFANLENGFHKFISGQQPWFSCPWASNKPSWNWCYHQLPDQLIINLMNNGNGRTLLLTVLVYQAKVPTGPVGACELSHLLLISLWLHVFNNIANRLDSWAFIMTVPQYFALFRSMWSLVQFVD